MILYFDIRRHNSYIGSDFRMTTERSAAWLAHYLGVVGVAGSNPAVPTKTPPPVNLLNKLPHHRG